MSRAHHVKILPEYYDYVEKRIKNAEVRYNDRDYRAGDWLVLQEYSEGKYTGLEIVRRIKSVFPLDAIGLNKWVLLCLK